MVAESQPTPTLISYGRRLAMLAEEHPDTVAITYAPVGGEERTLTWREFDRRANQFARLFAAQGVEAGQRVVIGLPNNPEHVISAFAAWRLGANILPLRAALPPRERDALLELAAPALVIADWEATTFLTLNTAALMEAAAQSAEPLPDCIPSPGYALASGGSTGRPKLIINTLPQASIPGAATMSAQLLGFFPGHLQLVAGPLYHAMPFVLTYIGLFEDHPLVLMDRFEARSVVQVIARHRVQFAYLAPIMMRRLALLPDLDKNDLASLAGVVSTAAPCPPWLKRAMIDLVGAEKVYELYSSSEGAGSAIIRGDEWLAHPGSVGRDVITEFRILDALGNELPRGEVGEIYMRTRGTTGPTFAYLGSPPARTTEDGLTSIGDLGWLDAEGYLFIADRRTDMIITGGSNVYPAEVEAALAEHEGIGDSAVIGVPDEEWGKRIHAIIQPLDPLRPPTVAELDAHCRERLANYKVPKTYEFLNELPRSEAGKLRRSELATERETGWTEGMVKAR